MVNTQKAQGIIHGLPYIQHHRGYERFMWFCDYTKHIPITGKVQIYSVSGYPFFARPCPMKPRHGFVDSRVVNNHSELIALWDEMIRQDPGGEIILGTKYDDVKYSAIYVNSGVLSIGIGNDGATGGKGSISFPVAPHKFNNFLSVDSGLDIDDTIYVESILSNEKWHMTQNRGGPCIDAATEDFIPEDVEVKNIEFPINDLLLWEKHAKEFEKGTIVYAPGYTLASHAAIHCVLNNIPFITTECPEIGETIRRNSLETNSISREQFKRGLNAGLLLCQDISELDFRKLLYYSLSVLHNWAHLRSSIHSGWVLGSAAIIFAKLCASLVVGEHRYFGYSGRTGSAPKRGAVYNSSLNNGIAVFDNIPDIFRDFYYEDWEEGYGGYAWANCTQKFYKLWEVIVKQYNKEEDLFTNDDIFSIVGGMNQTTNIAHNNGWWLDKIAAEYDLDIISTNPGMSAFAIADVYMDIYQYSMKSLKIIPKLYFKESHDMQNTFDMVDGYVELVAGISNQPELCLVESDGSKTYVPASLSRYEVDWVKKQHNEYHLGTYGRIPIKMGSRGTFYIPGGSYRTIEETFRQ